MLISIVLVLESPTDATLPAYLGRANNAATLELIGQANSDLAARIHGSEGPKPLTCSGLLDGHQRSGKNLTVRVGQEYAVRMTGLTEEVSAILEDRLLVSRPLDWTLHGHRFRVIDAVCDATRHTWSGRSSYGELIARRVTAGANNGPRVTLLFSSPTAFRSAGMQVPLPTPELVFGSLVDRWNAFSNVAFLSEMREFGERVVAMSRYRLESRAVSNKGGSVTIGAVGQATYTALGSDRYWLAVMQALADFALFSGVGVQTTIGMGQCKRIK